MIRDQLRVKEVLRALVGPKREFVLVNLTRVKKKDHLQEPLDPKVSNELLLHIQGIIQKASKELHQHNLDIRRKVKIRKFI